MNAKEVMTNARSADPNGRTRRGFTRGFTSGFTLVEMLVVISIILLLLTIGILGYRSMERSGAEKQTRINLTNAESLLKQMTSLGNISRLEGPSDYSPAPLYPFDSNGNPQMIDPPSSQAAALALARNAMAVMVRHPDIKKAVAALPPQMMYTPPNGTPNPNDPPAMIDAWGNPLVFVPSGGLRNVQLEAGGTATVTSSGAVNNPQNRPFFVSAGPDGKYETGADNFYSFTVK
jgi:prepilin-type N-terminal cleavage/methylation domain-containing protein